MGSPITTNCNTFSRPARPLVVDFDSDCRYLLTLWRFERIKIKALTALVGGSIVSVWRLGKKMVLNGDLRLFHLTRNFLTLSKQCRPWSDTTFYGVWSGSALFANVPVQVLQITLFTRHWHHSDKTIAAINNSYLDFVQTRVLFHWSMIFT